MSYDYEIDFATADCEMHGEDVSVRECNACGMDTCSACSACEWCGA